jgi:hypothetical protein
LTDWRVLEGIEPWGQARDDWRIASQTSDFAMLRGIKKNSGQVFKTEDFILRFNTEGFIDPTKPQTPDEIEKHFREWVRATNARFAAQQGGVIPTKH